MTELAILWELETTTQSLYPSPDEEVKDGSYFLKGGCGVGWYFHNVTISLEPEPSPNAQSVTCPWHKQPQRRSNENQVGNVNEAFSLLC